MSKRTDARFFQLMDSAIGEYKIATLAKIPAAHDDHMRNGAVFERIATREYGSDSVFEYMDRHAPHDPWQEPGYDPFKHPLSYKANHP